MTAVVNVYDYAIRKKKLYRKDENQTYGNRESGVDEKAGSDGYIL